MDGERDPGGGRLTGALAVAAAVGLLVVATAPLGVLGADHLDAPGMQPPSGDFQADINDVYAFEAADAASTVVAVTTNPAAGVLSPTSFGSHVVYLLNVDRDGDAVADLAYKVTFSEPRGDGTQNVLVKLASGKQAQRGNRAGRPVAKGRTGQVLAVKGGGKVFAGLRSDPFFFDLEAFRGSVDGVDNGRSLCDGNANDFFEALNTLAIVLEVPDAALGDTIGVWASTFVEDHPGQVDRMGRPAINTVVNSSGPIVQADPDAKNVYNRSHPSNDVARFTDNVVAALQALSQFDAEGAYSDSQATALAGALLPDVLVYDTATAASGPLNGRALADDVIDLELRITTGGDPLGLFADRDADGAFNSDCVGPHDDYQAGFPYLGNPH
ncbi:MAG TPA: DUF4331 family protein [Nitriliruptorales bacterium]|nr:DUF4331 family protein [Nitriliruptorales bacterium]